MARKLLFFCGVLSSLLYVGTDVLGTMRLEGYSFTSQTVSELSAIDAPSRPFVVPLFLTYSVLAVIVFGASAGLYGPRVAANLPTPWAGVTERISIFAYLLWQVVLAITLLPSEILRLQMTSIAMTL